MNVLLQNLLKLQTLTFNQDTPAGDGAKAELRAKIPAQILGHYDRLVARGKKGIAVVRGQVCTACHMRVPIGVITTLMNGDDIQLCESCGRYLYLAPVEKTATAEVPVIAVPAKKPRKSKRALQAV